MSHPNYTIHQFQKEDLAHYNAMRLEALQAEPGVFGNSYAMEVALTGEQWMERVTATDRAYFGLYHNNDLVGITGIVATDQEKPHEAYMTHTYIRASHRGRGLSKMLYEARIKWARGHGITRLIIGHKRSNIASMKANQKFGFKYTHSESRDWPDGSTEDMLYYELEL